MGEFNLNIKRLLENWTVARTLPKVIANALYEQALTGHLGHLQGQASGTEPCASYNHHWPRT